MPRGISALIALVLTLIVLVGFLILIAQPLVFELTTLLRNAPSYASQIGAMAREFWQNFDTQSNPAVKQTVELAIEQASSIGISVASGIFELAFHICFRQHLFYGKPTHGLLLRASACLLVG